MGLVSCGTKWLINMPSLLCNIANYIIAIERAGTSEVMDDEVWGSLEHSEYTITIGRGCFFMG